MKIPSTIKIGGIVYRVGNDPEKECFGSGSQKEQYINIDTSKSPDRQEATLIHEILHQVLNECGYMKESANEKMVTVVAFILHQVLRENNLLK